MKNYISKQRKEKQQITRIPRIKTKVDFILYKKELLLTHLCNLCYLLLKKWGVGEKTKNMRVLCFNFRGL